MIRRLYSAAWWLALPLVLGRLWWRGHKEPGYRRHISERLGFYAPFYNKKNDQPVIWIHAVSVGETRAAEPLIEALLDAYPHHRIVLTHMTPTGRATGESLFKKHGLRVVQSYLPYDTGWMMKRFIKHFRPRLCILMETEVWPNLIAKCNKYAVPVILANARLSERSLKKAQKLPKLMGDAVRGISSVAAQTSADAERIQSLGVCNVHITGSIKFDVTPPPEVLEKGRVLRQQIGTRPVLLCASTREGEEELILDALLKLGKNLIADTLVVIVPRHPQRFDDVARLIDSRGLFASQRSRMGSAALSPDVQVLLGDSMGEMFAYYAACDVAFIGGSLLPLGGQNLIEACAVSKPVLIGPHTFNFSLVSEEAIAAGGALRVSDASSMLTQAVYLFQHVANRNEIGKRAYAFSQHHRGAASRTLGLLKTLLA